MKRFYFQFRMMLITLALGLASVGFFNWLNNYLTEIPVDLPKVESGSPIIVLPRKNGENPFRGGGGAGGGKSCISKNKIYQENSKIELHLSNENVRNKN